MCDKGPSKMHRAHNKSNLCSRQSLQVRCRPATCTAWRRSLGMANAVQRESPAHSIFVLGLTGSIGMGKSTVTSMFRKHRVPVSDADQIVHELYAVGGAAVKPVSLAFPSAVAANGGIDKAALSKCVVGDEAAIKQLEALVHPLVAARRRQFLQQAAQEGATLAVLDVPLLYESGTDTLVDAVAVVSAPAEVQRLRVLSRPGMTAAKFEAILARQLPDEAKRARADYLIDTNTSHDSTEEQVLQLITQLSGKSGSGRSL